MNETIDKKLKELFDPFINLDISVWSNFAKLGDVCEFPAETVLKQSNTTERYMNFILKGSGGNLLWKNNDFICIDIAFEKDILLDFMSFTLQKATPIEVRLFEDSVIFRVSHANFQQTFASGSHGETVSRLVAEASYIYKQQQQIDLLSKTATQRYLEILTRSDMKRTPLKYIASYLGITPQSLSRIRADLPNVK